MKSPWLVAIVNSLFNGSVGPWFSPWVVEEGSDDGLVVSGSVEGLESGPVGSEGFGSIWEVGSWLSEGRGLSELSGVWVSSVESELGFGLGLTFLPFPSSPPLVTRIITTTAAAITTAAIIDTIIIIFFCLFFEA